MADNTQLNIGAGGDLIRTEDIGGGIKVQVAKIHNGAADVDGGAITIGNPFAVQICSGTDVVGTVTHPIYSQNISGSITGLLVGGAALSTANPVPVVGTVTLSAQPQIASGSVTGLLIGGVSLAGSNPLPVTGSITLASAPTVFAASGSITGLLVGGVALSAANPVPVTGASGLLIGGVQASLVNPVPIYTAVEGGGLILSGSTVRTVQYAFGDFGVSGSTNQVIAPLGAGLRIRVLSAIMMTPTAVFVRWLSTGSAGTITNISGLMTLPAAGGFVLPHNPHGWFQTVANEGLNLSVNATVSCGLIITWIIAGP